MIYACCDRLRRDKTTLNGIDYLQVIDGELPATDPLRQRTLLVHMLKPIPAPLSSDNVQVIGGERVRDIDVEWAAPATPLPSPLGAPEEAATAAVVGALTDADHVLVVRTDVTGDFSTYTLRVVASPVDDAPPPGFDAQLVEVDFSFKVECPSDFDCAQPVHCPCPVVPAPDIDYLAKDYASFRRLLLDRVARLVPAWRQDSVADFGIALVELLAYAGDQLSYQQDATATEAYLGTARRRVSLRRHAVMVDYPMHDGCNARAWLQLQVGPAHFVLRLAGTQFLTRCPDAPPSLARDSQELAAALQTAPLVFEPLLEARYAPSYERTLHAAHNEMRFYTWSDDRCCLATGATHATLHGHFPDLQVGDALLLEERVGPRTGKAGDADRAHRHVVRLTRIAPTAPATLTDPVTGEPITEIDWARDDALPFALCISAVTDEAHGLQHIDDISVARGNLILVDHGERIADDALGAVPPVTLFRAPGCDSDRCTPQPPQAIPPRFRPQLREAPLTQAAGRYVHTASGAIGTQPQPFDSFAPAARAMDRSMRDALPQIVVASVLEGNSATWQAQRTLLNSGASAADFVVEIDDDNGARLRFGDGVHGVRPDSGTAFTAAYRVGNGSAGNAGADTIVHFVGDASDIADVLAVRNPLPAVGGVDPEDSATVRRNAPEAFRTQERAVTTDDYARVAERNRSVQRAAATLRWTGSWYTVFTTVDPLAGADTAPLKNDLATFVDRYRMAGHDLEFNDPRYVSLEIALHVCVKDDYFRSDVLPDGRRGLFHPDNFSFGQSVFLSPIYAAAHQVPGVGAVEITAFQRQGTPDKSFLDRGELPLGRLEVARLDNDVNFPERGVLRLELDGGR
jgi:hypothetical protein